MRRRGVPRAGVRGRCRPGRLRERQRRHRVAMQSRTRWRRWARCGSRCRRPPGRRRTTHGRRLGRPRCRVRDGGRGVPDSERGRRRLHGGGRRRLRRALRRRTRRPRAANALVSRTPAPGPIATSGGAYGHPHCRRGGPVWAQGDDLLVWDGVATALGPTGPAQVLVVVTTARSARSASGCGRRCVIVGPDRRARAPVVLPIAGHDLACREVGLSPPSEIDGDVSGQPGRFRRRPVDRGVGTGGWVLPSPGRRAMPGLVSIRTTPGPSGTR